MKTAFGDPEYVKRVARMQVQAMQVNPPAIPFRRDRKKQEEQETKKIKIKTDPSDEDSDEIEVYAKVFDEGDAESWIQWRIQLDDLIWDKQLTDGWEKTVLAKALLKGSAREKFCDILLDIDINQDDADINEEDVFKEAIDRLGLNYFPSENAYRRQRNYLRYHLFMMDMSLWA